MIAIVGLGQAGSRAALALAQEPLLLVDRDVVAAKDVGQAYRTSDIGKPKAEALGKRMGKRFLVSDVTPRTRRFLGTPDLVIDGTDNYETRFLLNRFCVEKKIPFIFSAAAGDEALCARFEGGPCLRCLFRTAPRDELRCTGRLDRTLLRHLAARIHALSLAPGMPHALYSLQGGRGKTSVVRKNPRCPVCGPGRRAPQKTRDRRPKNAVRRLCGDTVQITPANPARLQGIRRFARPGASLTVFPDGRALAHGKVSPGAALRWYRRARRAA